MQHAFLSNPSPTDPVIGIVESVVYNTEHDFEKLNLPSIEKIFIIKHCNRYSDSFNVQGLWKHREEIHLLAFDKELSRISQTRHYKGGWKRKSIPGAGNNLDKDAKAQVIPTEQHEVVQGTWSKAFTAESERWAWKGPQDRLWGYRETKVMLMVMVHTENEIKEKMIFVLPTRDPFSEKN